MRKSAKYLLITGVSLFTVSSCLISYNIFSIHEAYRNKEYLKAHKKYSLLAKYIHLYKDNSSNAYIDHLLIHGVKPDRSIKISDMAIKMSCEFNRDEEGNNSYTNEHLNYFTENISKKAIYNLLESPIKIKNLEILAEHAQKLNITEKEHMGAYIDMYMIYKYTSSRITKDFIINEEMNRALKLQERVYNEVLEKARQNEKYKLCYYKTYAGLAVDYVLELSKMMKEGSIEKRGLKYYNDICFLGMAMERRLKKFMQEEAVKNYNTATEMTIEVDRIKGAVRRLIRRKQNFLEEERKTDKEEQEVQEFVDEIYNENGKYNSLKIFVEDRLDGDESNTEKKKDIIKILYDVMKKEEKSQKKGK